MLLGKDDLGELLALNRAPAVSIYFPTELPGRETHHQDPIRLRNLLNGAGKRLAAEKRGPEAAALLEPARKLVDDEAFWKDPASGLAVFLAPDFHRIHKLPIAVPEELFVGAHFYIKPLLPLVDRTGAFWVLTVSARVAHLYRATRWSIAEVTELDLPQGVAELRRESEFQEQHYAAPTAGPARAGQTGLEKAQSFGESPEDLRKDQLIEYLRRVAAAIEAVVRRQPAPVVLAAAPEIQGHFRTLANWKDLVPDGLLENPDAMAGDELHAKACKLIEPREEEERTAALDRLNSLLGNQAGKATRKVEDIVKAAHQGRVDRLFLSSGDHLWGRFDAQTDSVTAHDAAVEGDDDLLDYAALMTLRQGGCVTLVDRTRLPPDGPAAAILRY